MDEAKSLTPNQFEKLFVQAPDPQRYAAVRGDRTEELVKKKKRVSGLKSEGPEEDL